MKNKKGFTLIELLAVIVILAIIALIAVPTIMNVLNKANKSAFKDTAYGIISAGELYFAEQQLELNGMSENAEFTWPNDIGTLQVKGNVPDGTVLHVNTNGETALAMSNGRYCAIKRYDDKDVTITEDINNCTLYMQGKTLSELAVETEENDVDSCIYDAQGCLPGTPLNIKVNDEETYSFIVVEDNIETQEITLLTNDSVALVWSEWYSGKDVSKGPLTALEQLEEKASNWTNIEPYTYTLEDDSETPKYQPILRENVRARMLSYTDIKENLYQTYWQNFNTMWLSTTGSTNMLVFNGGIVGDLQEFIDQGSIDESVLSDISVLPVIKISTRGRETYTNGIMSSGSNCINEGTCEAGTVVHVQVNEKEAYRFRVLNDENDKLTLIMSENLGDNVAWNASGNITEGPVTLLKALKEGTSNWTNIEQYSYELNSGTTYVYNEDGYDEEVEIIYSGEYVQNVRARLPRLSDLSTEAIGCGEWGSCPSWLHEDNNAYWLSDGSTDLPEAAWVVDSWGNFYNDIYVGATDSGVRPVITLTK